MQGSRELLQKHPKGWRSVSYNSRNLNDTQRRIHATMEKKLCAVINSIKKFRSYLIQKFTVVTDLNALVHLKNSQNPSIRLGRWAVFLSQWEFEVIHCKRKLHADTDWLSRNVFENALSESAESVEMPLHLEIREAEVAKVMREQKNDNTYKRIMDLLRNPTLKKTDTEQRRKKSLALVKGNLYKVRTRRGQTSKYLAVPKRIRASVL